MERVDFDGGFRRRGQGSLGPLAGCAETTDGPWVGLEVFLVPPLEIVNKVVDHSVIKIFSTQVSVSILDLEKNRTISDHVKYA